MEIDVVGPCSYLLFLLQSEQMPGDLPSLSLKVMSRWYEVQSQFQKYSLAILSTSPRSIMVISERSSNE